MKRTALMGLVSALIISSCSTTESPEGTNTQDDLIIMPSLGRGANRGNSEKKEQKEKEETPSEPQAPILTEEQQQQAKELLTQEESTAPQEENKPLPEAKEVKPSTPPPLELLGVPGRLRAEPVEYEEEDAEEAAPPPPNSIELKGLRSPKLPNSLPMKLQ